MHVLQTLHVIQLTVVTNALRQQLVYIIISRAWVFLSNHVFHRRWLLLIKCLSMYLLYNELCD